MPNVLRAKCPVVGESGVGKSSLTRVFASDGANFPKNYVMTCGVEVQVKSVKIPDTDDIVELYLYDSSGKDVYFSSLSSLFEHPSVFCAVYDVTDGQSFEKISRWVNLVTSAPPQIPITGVLLANKTDLSERRTVNPKTGEEFALKNNLQYFESSAKNNKGVEEPFFYLANEWHKVYVEKTGSFKTFT